MATGSDDAHGYLRRVVANARYDTEQVPVAALRAMLDEVEAAQRVAAALETLLAFTWTTGVTEVLWRGNVVQLGEDVREAKAALAALKGGG